MWSERALPLAYILKDNALPIVVKVRFMPLTFLLKSVAICCLRVPLAYIMKDNALPIVVKVRSMPLTFLLTSVA